LFALVQFPDLGLFAQSEIAELDVSAVVDQYVVGFEIPMDVVHLMHGLDRQNLRLSQWNTISDM
jgi:hypothetical protein